MITETQSHNKNEFNLKLNQKRNSVDADRLESQKIARENIEKAAFIDQLEREEVVRKKNQHKKELELLINERAQANMFKNAPVTEASMSGLRMLPEHAEKLML